VNYENILKKLIEIYAEQEQVKVQISIERNENK